MTAPRRVLVLAEGFTERDFVLQVLQPHLERRGIHASPVVFAPGRRTHATRGGHVRLTKLAKELSTLLTSDRTAACVTSLIDYQGLRIDIGELGSGASAPEIEDWLRHRLGNPRVLPYLQVHEFEALLFSDPEKVCAELEQPAKSRQVSDVVKASGGPENIDTTPEGKPSARLARFFPGYKKRVDGVRVAQAIGLGTMRSSCPRFAEWLAKLEAT